MSVAELHDLTSRNQGNLKPDMSSMYHHHMMQTGRQPHPSDMHDFLSGADPMAASLPAALGLAASDTGGHHPGSSVGNQLHSPSALYSSHHHGAMNSKRTGRPDQCHLTDELLRSERHDQQSAPPQFGGWSTGRTPAAESVPHPPPSPSQYVCVGGGRGRSILAPPSTVGGGRQR